MRHQSFAKIETSRPGGTEHDYATNGLRKWLKESLGHFTTPRDEVHVKLHVGRMDVKEQWKKLEPHLEEVEKKAEDLTEASRVAVTEAVKRLQKLRSSLAGHN